jgi:hypothetical protein
MTRVVGPSLTPALVARFSQRDVASHLGVAIPFVTLDREGRPHPMIVTYLEIRAYDTTTMGLVIQAQSGSARNLAERRVGTLVVVEPDAIIYVKTRTVDGPLEVAGDEGLGLGYFLLEIEQVTEDSAADWEAGMRITTPCRYAPAPDLDSAWARATLAALRSPRARA